MKPPSLKKGVTITCLWCLHFVWLQYYNLPWVKKQKETRKAWSMLVTCLCDSQVIESWLNTLVLLMLLLPLCCFIHVSPGFYLVWVHTHVTACHCLYVEVWQSPRPRLLPLPCGTCRWTQVLILVAGIYQFPLSHLSKTLPFSICRTQQHRHLVFLQISLEFPSTGRAPLSDTSINTLCHL